MKGLSDVIFHEEITAPIGNVICKCLHYSLQNTEIQSIQKYYNKKIWIIRDPRDRLISAFLYRWYHKHKRSQQKFNKTLDKVLLKESEPGSVPFYKIIECSFNLNVYLNGEKRIVQDLISTFKLLDDSWFILKYENFISNNITDLESYLAFGLNKKPKNNFSLNRVKRTTTLGNWKNWFTPEDIELLKPIFQPALNFFSYNNNWSLNQHQQIDKKEASEYLIKINKPESWFNKINQKLKFIIKG